ncbi:prolipoprotein diacylglyceryl transferase [Acidimicrobium ferrooxidans DSM 10331]|uniref:Prolipoprotein diacylglyceryl transferase n=1 Tax=Acidimicrobium ferrooxidans (strain DSM 10331 / JCM 15462 / NBRC 103882 / ICP) TaxID=525909 RepID=C7M0H2_ACIFD|nr:prolipoprotein diacylglyceryl transferase family protein [Acidimicrobium ferrooxidans]ACU54480.1 prolipoprotein diacylglyceryl transferase [Acidimicrobium ferrooxidans DSM 10331]
MKPIPVEFHLGPLVLHTYGFGLGVTFWFAYWYLGKRFRRFGLSSTWLERGFIPIIVMAIVGARVVHVVANIEAYLHNPIGVFEVWQGGLSSYGGLAGGIPTALWYLHRDMPNLRFRRAFDIAAPVLLASWSMGRLLGPQLMYAGGGLPTKAWYGMYYTGEIGKRIPVPIFQSIEDFTCFLLTLWIARHFARWRMPAGSVAVAALGLWSIERFFDEFLWLARPRVWDAVEVFALICLAFCAATLAVLTSRRGRTTEVVDLPKLVATGPTA